jgi:predicted PurR-regulated permease PerM
MSGDVSVVDTGLKVLHWLDTTVTPHLQSLGIELKFEQIRSKVKEAIQPMLQSVAMYLGGVLSSTPQLIIFSTVSWMSWIYFLVYGREQRESFLPHLLPFPEERQVLAKSLGDVLKAMVLTSIVLSVVQSFLVFVSLGIVGIPKFYLWGALSFFLSFVPVVGTAPVMLSAALYLYQQGQMMGAIFVLAMAFVIGMADNIVRPLLMKGGSDLSFFWLFLSLLGGIAMFGLSGAILGPWAFALFRETWVVIEQKKS